MASAIRMALQIPNFSDPGTPPVALFDRVAGSACEAELLREEFLRARNTLPASIQQSISDALVVGDPDTVGEFVQTRIVGQGLDGIVVNLPANGHDPAAVKLAARTLSAALR
jgi:hypothetical protein